MNFQAYVHAYVASCGPVMLLSANCLVPMCAASSLTVASVNINEEDYSIVRELHSRLTMYARLVNVSCLASFCLLVSSSSLHVHASVCCKCTTMYLHGISWWISFLGQDRNWVCLGSEWDRVDGHRVETKWRYLCMRIYGICAWMYVFMIVYIHIRIYLLCTLPITMIVHCMLW